MALTFEQVIAGAPPTGGDSGSAINDGNGAKEYIRNLYPDN